MAERRSHRFALIGDLNAEWAELCEHQSEPVRDWASASPALEGCQTLPEVLAAIRRGPDTALAALLTQAAGGELLASRTVLQAMLGKVVRLAQTYPDVGVDEFISALWCRIRTYPLARRPTSIAANLALDTRKDALAGARGRRREHSAGSLSEPAWEHLFDTRAGSEPRGWFTSDARIEARWVIEAARAIGVIDAATSSVLRTVYLDGASSQAAALRHDTTPAMVRYRCSQALRRMARHAAALAAAA